MVKSFRHKQLELFFTKDIKKGLNSKDVLKISRILDRLDAVLVASDMNIPGWDLHELSGKRKGVWTVSVRQNWKITFRIIDGEVCDVNLEDYH
jgi:proteic killer suppression protein